ncbi:hypothetical protein EYF80_056505 [Liparis tanakae]|uniref:Uncharacterized protein n=1 Tax=Liparis tanakae TaxID=230148 RepID=A0A4Z2EYB7_9TELE|nr:hypothetical protein EYF80_056505 [Liparis tanakae]
MRRAKGGSGRPDSSPVSRNFSCTSCWLEAGEGASPAIRVQDEDLSGVEQQHVVPLGGQPPAGSFRLRRDSRGLLVGDEHFDLVEGLLGAGGHRRRAVGGLVVGGACVGAGDVDLLAGVARRLGVGEVGDEDDALAGQHCRDTVTESPPGERPRGGGEEGHLRAMWEESKGSKEKDRMFSA